MVKEILIYIEGDTKKGNANAVTLRRGFSEFFKNLAGEINIPIKPVMGGGRETTIKLFLGSLDSYPKGFVILLVDSDTEIDENETPKSFLQKISPKFDFSEVKDEQCHLMVQVMESWFLADKEKLAEFYGKGFNLKALPKNKEVERIPKDDVISGLKKATRNTSKKEYGKGLHSGEILQRIDSKKVREAAPHCERLFITISKITDG
ncbi:MAG TPA: DUF4276 family protein [Pyrinomonadaceae bacterium]|nr:DUF4276 family protein [Pyrinomonadaceae bacterium]